MILSASLRIRRSGRLHLSASQTPNKSTTSLIFSSPFPHFSGSSQSSKDYLFLLKLDGFFFLIGIVFHSPLSYTLTCVSWPSLEILAVKGFSLRPNSRSISSFADMIRGPHCFGPSLLSVVTNTAIPASTISFDTYKPSPDRQL